MEIKPLAAMSRGDIRDSAYEAADRGENKDEANPFAPGTLEHSHFEHDFLQRDRVLAEVS